MIDFGNLAIGDPACDLMIAWNLLSKRARASFQREIEVDNVTWERGLGWALASAMLQLSYYKNTNPTLRKNAEHVMKEILEEKKSPKTFQFKPVKPEQQDFVHLWLEQEHIRKWIHGVGLQNTLDGLAAFFQGEKGPVYWIGYDKNTPFSFLITSPEGQEAICLDVFICDTNYLGKGLGAYMIQQFLSQHFSHMKKILIDPQKTNTRAVHVYKKVGFTITGEFIASWHKVPHYQMEVTMEDLLKTMEKER